MAILEMLERLSKRLDGWIRLKLDGKVAALVAALRPAITKVWILEIAL